MYRSLADAELVDDESSPLFVFSKITTSNFIVVIKFNFRKMRSSQNKFDYGIDWIISKQKYVYCGVIKFLV